MMMARLFACAGALGLLSLASCGNSVDPASQAVVSVHVAQLSASTTPPLSCPPGPHWASVPETPAGDAQVTTTFAGKRAVDGEEGRGVKCTVAQSGDKFNVSATLQSPAAGGSGASGTNIVLATTIGADEEGASGTLRLFDDKTQRTYTSDTCSFSVKAGAGEGLSIKPGNVWGKFTCTMLSDPGSVGTGCRVDDGYFVLETCAL